MVRSVAIGQGIDRRERLLWVAAVLAAVWLVLIVSSQPQSSQAQGPGSGAADKPREPSTEELIGIDRIERRLGPQTPTGRGIIVGHVESLSDGGYVPRVQGDRFGAVQFSFASTPAQPSGHASATAMVIYGPGGLAPGISQVVCYQSMHWLGAGFLRPTGDGPPMPGRIRVFTHSWIGGDDGQATLAALRRVDHLVDAHDVIVVAGVNNNATSAMPALVGSAYNAIAVGHFTGQSSGGYTTTDTPGRCKPDLVAPGGRTSFSTAVVTAVVARLLEQADALGPDSPAARSEVIKAALLAGAHKPASWRAAEGKPLDEHLGAGQVRYDRSYEIMESGGPQQDRITRRAGWQFASLGPGSSASLGFDSASALRELSVALVWNRRIENRMANDLLTGRPRWLDQPRLADFDLALHVTDDAGQTRLVARSASTIDNVEHIFQRELPPGRYRLEVTRRVDGMDAAWDYALAWHMDR